MFEPQLSFPRRGWVVQVIPFLFALTAFILSASTLTSCHFLLSENDNSSPQPYGLFRSGFDDVQCSTTRHRQAQLNALNALDENNQVANIKLPAELKVAESGGILACLFGFTALALLFSAFFSQRMVAFRVWRIVLPILTILAGVFQLMTFSVFGTPGICVPERGDTSVITCSFSEGANLSFAASILYLMLGIGIIFFPRRSVPLCTLPDHKRDSELSFHGADSSQESRNRGSPRKGTRSAEDDGIVAPPPPPRPRSSNNRAMTDTSSSSRRREQSRNKKSKRTNQQHRIELGDSDEFDEV